MRSYEIDMTTGSLPKKILMYTLPLMLTSVLQLLYNAMDLIVVGKFAEQGSLAAVGATGAIINLLVNLFMGLSVGTSITVSKHIGAKEDERASAAAHTSVVLAVICGLMMGVAGFFLSRPLLSLMETPADVIDRSVLYMKIYFIGIPGNMIYNFGAAILRAIGDTKRPLNFLTVAGILNVVLNLVFVIVFRMGVAGVAIATAISQYASAILVIRCLIKTDGPCGINIKKLRVDIAEMKQIARIGLPAGLQGSIFSISNVLIQSSVNSFGSVVMEGNAAAGNIEGFVYVTMNSVYHASMNFTGQNYGARKYKRIDKVYLWSFAIVCGLGVTASLLAYLLRYQLLDLYLPTDSPSIKYGAIRMTAICLPYVLAGMMDIGAGMMRGLGYAITPMLVSLVGACGFRIIWIYTVFAAHRELYVLYVSYALSWIITFAAHVLCYLIARRRFPPDGELPVVKKRRSAVKSEA